jgi:hypothetical protein
MVSRIRDSLLVFGFLSLLIIPASAGFTLQDVQVYPTGENLQPGTPASVSATAQIIPQGPTTFIEGYTMVTSTEVDRASWDIAIIVDGRRTAVFRKTGSTVFINGYLLSYPTSRDVAVKIKVDGYAPSVPAGSPFTVLRVIELNNQGQLISGSEQTVSRLTGSVTPEHTSGTTTPTVTIPEATTKAGMLSWTAIGGMGAMLLLLNAGRIKRP